MYGLKIAGAGNGKGQLGNKKRDSGCCVYYLQYGYVIEIVISIGGFVFVIVAYTWIKDIPRGSGVY